MDWLTFIVEIAKLSAWPLLIAGLVCHFRKQLRQGLDALVSRMQLVTSWEMFGMKFVFEKAEAAVETRAEAATQALRESDDPAQRNRLEAELEAANQELLMLRAAKQRMVQGPMWPSSLEVTGIAAEVFNLLISDLSADKVLVMGADDLSKNIIRSLQKKDFLPGFTYRRLDALEKRGVWADGKLTPMGIIQLRHYAANQRGPNPSSPAPSPS